MAKEQEGPTVINTPQGIRIYQLLAVKSAIKLEKLGMRHSCGRSVRKMWAVQMGLKPTAKADEVITAIQAEIDRIHTAPDYPGFTR